MNIGWFGTLLPTTFTNTHIVAAFSPTKHLKRTADQSMQNKLPSLILSLCVLLLPIQVMASPAPSAALRVLHQKVLKDPANLDKLYAYAQFAINEGNFESAIGAMEGMLVIASNQPRVLLELGVLYQRLGVVITANTYLQKAKDLSPPDSEIARLADEYLVEVEDKESRHTLSGVLQFGLRYQSNPTFAPEAIEIRSGGYNVPLPEARKRNSDINALLFTNANHHYVLSKRFSIATDMVLYGTAYDDNTNLNFGVIEMSSGPQFTSGLNAAGQYSVRPHIVLRASNLDGSLFEETAGLGIDFQTTLGMGTLISARYQYRDITYKDYNDIGTMPLYSGSEHREILHYRNELFRGQVLDIGLTGIQHGAERQFFETNLYEASLRYSIKFNNILPRQSKMTLTPYVIRQWVDYEAPDTEIDPVITRKDRQWRLGLSYQLPVIKSWSMILNLERLETDSNIINYDVVNNMGMLSLQIGF